MWPFVALALAGLVLVTGTAEKRHAPGSTAHTLAELVAGMLDAPLTEREAVAAELDTLGETALAATLRAGVSPIAPPIGEGSPPDVQAVAELVAEWRTLGGDEMACLQIAPSTIEKVQHVFGIDATGVYDLETAIVAQNVDPNAPASCEWVSP